MNLHFLLWAGLLFGSQSIATSFYIRPLPEFARDAPNIIRGRVHQPHAENTVGPGGEQGIYTYAEIEVMEVLKGDIAKASVSVRRPGGTKDGITLEVPGAPDLQDGEESVFFLGEEQADHSFEITGLELGQFGLEEKNGELVLTGGLLGFPETPDFPGAPKSEVQRVWTLKQLKSLIESQKSLPPSPGSASSKPRGPAPSPASAKVDEPRSPGWTSPVPEPAPSSFAPSDPDSAKTAGILFLAGGFLLGIFLYLRRK